MDAQRALLDELMGTARNLTEEKRKGYKEIRWDDKEVCAFYMLSGLFTTYGYGAPEFESGIYTSKSDVYSFGVVMLELLTGRMSYDRTRIRGEQYLVRWAIPQLHDIDLLSRMVDPALDGKYPVKSVSHFADIISRCVQTEPEFRPLMSEVVQDLIQMIRRESPNRSGE